MNGVAVAAVVLWTTTLALGGAVAVEGGAIAVDDDRTLSVDLETAIADVSLDNLGENESPTGSVHAAGIDDGVERDSGTGLCAVGLDSGASPVAFDTDADNSSVTIDADAEYDPDNGSHPHDRKTAQEIVEECSATDTETRSDSPR